MEAPSPSGSNSSSFSLAFVLPKWGPISHLSQDRCSVKEWDVMGKRADLSVLPAPSCSSGQGQVP